jgi:hypothetical protein
MARAQIRELVAKEQLRESLLVSSILIDRQFSMSDHTSWRILPSRIAV